MSDALLMAFSNPVEGREDEYNKWYDEVHLSDVLAVPGIVSGRRYELAPGGRGEHRFLAVYDVEGDPREAVRELISRMKTGEIPLSDAIDPAAGSLAVWIPRGDVRTA
jgi:hypothetical protein